MQSSEPPPGGGGGGGKTCPPPTEWVEIIEPRSGEHMYANLTTGECVWDPPVGVAVKKTNDNQWWELFDQNTSRFYYYNASSQKTVWHRPADCDIIPLAKLQTLKQNTEVKQNASASALEEAAGDLSDQALSPGKRRLKKQVMKHRKRAADSLNQTDETNAPIAKVLPAMGSSSVNAVASHFAQTSPVASPRSSRRRSHRHPKPKFEDDFGNDVRLQTGGSLRLSRNEAKASQSRLQQQISATASPGLSKQRSLEGENFRRIQQKTEPPHPVQPPQLPIIHSVQQQQQPAQAQNPHHNQPIQIRKPSPPSQQPLISRSVSFMSSSRPAMISPSIRNHYDNYGPLGWKGSSSGGETKSGGGGRSSVESTPVTSRRSSSNNHNNNNGGNGTPDQPPLVNNNNPTGSPVLEGYCTPLSSRKLSSGSSAGSFKPLPRPRTSIGSTSSSQQQQQQQSHSLETTNKELSISELVDSGLTALGADNNDHDAVEDETSIGSPRPKMSKPPRSNSMRSNSNGTTSSDNKITPQSSSTKMSPLQAYILEQAKLSGYSVADVDRDSYVESDLDDRGLVSDSDEFADDEDGGLASGDDLSKASSSIHDEDEYLSEPTYNNLDPVWMAQLRKVHHQQSSQKPPEPPSRTSSTSASTRPLPAPRSQSQQPPSSSSKTLSQQQQHDIDAFSEEFDLRMRVGGNSSRGGNNSSTMPRPVSHQQPSVHHQQQHGGPRQPPPGSHMYPMSASHHHPQGHSTLNQQQQHQQQQQYQQNPNFPVPYEVLHPSLQRNAHSLMVDSMTSSALQRAASGSVASSRPPHLGSSLSVSASLHSTMSVESDIEKYAQENFNVQKKGLFRKRLSVKAILTWTTESISKPLTCVSSEKVAKKEAVQAFRLIQIYMGDRKAKPGMTINSVAMDVCHLGYGRPSLRDEIYVQLAKQTTDNPKKDSLRRGWELMAICLAFFPPSATFGPFLQGYIVKHRDPSLDEFPDAQKWPIHIQISHYAGICAKRLERIGEGGRLMPKKPGLEDIDQARLLIFRPSMFGGTLQETMEIQRDRFPHRKLPWILTTMAEQILRLNGSTTEGIFRVPADMEEVQSLKSRIDQWEVVVCRDCHTAASLLKMWLRDLYEPLIPDSFYDECIALAVNLDKQTNSSNAASPEKSKRLSTLVSRMPEINALVLTYLVRFLQLFARPEVANNTKMDDSNLATVFAPNCLRCPSNDPLVIMENTRKEMAFVKHMIQNLETSAVDGIL